MKSAALETPMMRQYLQIKARHPDAILFYRMGDFYEMFLEDAELVAPLLEIALTSRDKDKADAVPMCGVPVHSADGYIKRLASLGYRVAICEQVEQVEQVEKAGSSQRRKLVRREVIEVVTPGLVGDPEGLDSRKEVTVAAIDLGEAQSHVGLAVLEASTGDFRATEIAISATSSNSKLPELLVEELRRIDPREVLVPDPAFATWRAELESWLPDVACTPVSLESFDPTTAPVFPAGFDRDSVDCGSRAAAALLVYVGMNQPFALSHPPRLRRYRLGDAMVLDAATRRHLELFENGEDRGGSAHPGSMAVDARPANFPDGCEGRVGLPSRLPACALSLNCAAACRDWV